MSLKLKLTIAEGKKFFVSFSLNTDDFVGNGG